MKRPRTYGCGYGCTPNNIHPDCQRHTTPPPLQPEKGNGGDEPDAEDGPWAEGWKERSEGAKPELPAPTGDEELRVKIAEWMGWKYDPSCGPLSLHWRNTNVPAWDGNNWSGRAAELPAYTTSLDAIASAEAKLTDEQQIQYMMHLAETTKLERYPVGFGEVFVLTHAPAQQRATALYRLLQTIEEKEQRE